MKYREMSRKGDNNMLLPGMSGKPKEAPAKLAGKAAASQRRLEGKGASLVTQSWLGAFGALGAAWHGEDFCRRLRKRVLATMDEDRQTDGPRSYDPCLHFALFGWFEVKRKLGFQKRMQVEVGVGRYENGMGAVLKIKRFDSRKGIRRPRNCNHFRLFLAMNGMCTYRYSEGKNCYVASRPDFLDLNAVTFSDMTAFGTVLKQGLELHVTLPDHVVPDADCAGIVAVGLEFWYFGRTAPDGRLVERAMAVS